MKKTITSLVGLFLLTVCLSSAEILVEWDEGGNEPGSVTGTKIYISTNSFIGPIQTMIVPEPLTTAAIQIEPGLLYSMYATAVGTNGTESIPSNQIRYQRFHIRVGITNELTLLGTTNWAGVKVIKPPSNGVLFGTLPNVYYYPTNWINSVTDSIKYELTETWESIPVTNNYSVIFTYDNVSPNITQ